MEATAYLVAYLRHNPRINGQAVAHVAIKSEGAMSLTGGGGSTYADLLRCDGKDYQDAIDNVLATVRQYKHLHWTLPWIDREAWPSEKREAFIRSVQESFRPDVVERL